MERLQKVMAQAGVASRRACEQMIDSGRVQVNGQRVTQQGTKIDPQRDQVAIDGKPISLKMEKLRHILLYKPPGYVTTLHDPQGRPTVIDLVADVPERIYPVGRLDYDSEGLLLMTNDGELAMKLTHPRYGVEKTYMVELVGQINPNTVAALSKGVELEDGWTAPAKVRVVGQKRGNSILEFCIMEGRNRQIRRMCQAVGHEIIRLTRVRQGPLTLGNLSPGSWRMLKQREIKALNM